MNQRHAYLILAHHEPEIFGTLLLLLDDERNDIYVHIDAKADTVPFQQQAHCHYSQVTFTKRMDVRWGDISEIKAEYILFETAYQHGPYAYYHLLSGVDLPLKSQAEIHRFFDEEHPGKEFVGFARGELALKNIHEKTDYYWLFPKHFKPGRFLLYEKARMAFITVQQRIGYRRKYTFEIHKGAQWVSITNDLCGYLLEHKRQMLSMFRHTLCPDEMFIQTLVWHSEYKARVYDIDDECHSCMRAVDWHRGDPYTWRSEDFDKLMATGRLFARKFSSNDMEIVRRIADSIQGH